MIARYLDRAERFEMIGLKLAIEQSEAAEFQARDKPRQRDFRCVARARDHAFPEKGAAQRQPV